jgi:proline dehydrogenase
VLRNPLLKAGRSPRVRRLVEGTSAARRLVERFVAGESLDEALPAVAEVSRDRHVTLDHLGEDVTTRDQAEQTVAAYTELLKVLGAAGLADRAEVSVKLSAVGRSLGPDGETLALDNARRICQGAAEAGTTVTLDMEDHTTTDSTLGILRALRVDFPWVGAVVQSYLRRTEADCRDLAGPGSRVRLCKGAYQEPAAVAFQDKHEVDRSYARCLAVLMRGEGYPMVATHDPRLVDLASGLAHRTGRGPQDYEYQMLYGVREAEQRRLSAEGARVRVYVPYGRDWYGYYMRRLAERPANVAFFLRALARRG